MNKNYIQPEMQCVALQQQTHLLVESVQDIGSNAGFKYGGATSGDVDARTKGNEWEDIWK